MNYLYLISPRVLTLINQLTIPEKRLKQEKSTSKLTYFKCDMGEKYLSAYIYLYTSV